MAQLRRSVASGEKVKHRNLDFRLLSFVGSDWNVVTEDR